MASQYATAFANPSGAGDARPTAMQILRDQKLGESSLSHLTAVVTGCTSGIGFETARAFYPTGMRVFITARTAERGREAASKIEAGATCKGQKIEVVEMSLEDLSSVRSGAASINERLGDSGLNLLVCNAGVMACPEGQTKDGYEMQFGVNHVSHFLLFHLLQPALVKGAAVTGSSGTKFDSRVVAVSSTGHRISGLHVGNYDFKQKSDDPYDPWLAYGQSKTANIYMANEIERRYGSHGVHGLSLHPGWINETSLSRHISADALDKLGITQQDIQHASSLEQGAATQVWASIAKELEGRGGLYLHDVAVDKPVEKGVKAFAPGYSPWAYDQELEAQLWKDSEAMVGLRA